MPQQTHNSIGRTLATLLASSAVLTIASGIAGCRGERSKDKPRQFIPNMDDSPKIKPQTGTSFFADGRGSREPVAGTVAFGTSSSMIDQVERGTLLTGKHAAFYAQDNRAPLLKDNDAFFRGITADDEFLPMLPEFDHARTDANGNPVALVVDADFIEIGKQKFEINCAICHGFDGRGQGTVGQRWAITLPDFHDPKYVDPAQMISRDGYIFDVIRNGLWDTVSIEDGAVKHASATGGTDMTDARMPAYADAVSEREAWAIVAYIRSLQASRDDDTSAVQDGALRQKLNDSRPDAIITPEVNDGPGFEANPSDDEETES